jgi:hypothetical protein
MASLDGGSREIRLDGKVVLVTGGGRGIGRAMAARSALRAPPSPSVPAPPVSWTRPSRCLRAMVAGR